jgi:hypothetical protein
MAEEREPAVRCSALEELVDGVVEFEGIVL